ncbi:hypothetical protein [Sorangium cellulosum]|uniref:Uncharacterized protein n=1 Tax=Sorangium cellulosum TaxID=56 RepID=A0A150QPV5_SORCE|nr:hypothetical protein [Sorangium cellulosum]KYF70021.1 hypothetical protein BE15_16700 [Sorangium cellulosum]
MTPRADAPAPCRGAGGGEAVARGLLCGFRVLAALYAVLMVWQGRGFPTETPQPVALAEGEPE